MGTMGIQKPTPSLQFFHEPKIALKNSLSGAHSLNLDNHFSLSSLSQLLFFLHYIAVFSMKIIYTH